MNQPVPPNTWQQPEVSAASANVAVPSGADLDPNDLPEIGSLNSSTLDALLDMDAGDNGYFPDF